MIVALHDEFEKIKILHLVNGLGVGGVEKRLIQVLPKLDRSLYDITVCSLKDEGVYGRILAEEYKFDLITLKGRGKWDIGVYWGLVNYLKDKNYVIIHSYLYWSNLLARLCKRKLGIPIVINAIEDTEVWRRWYHQVIDYHTSRWTDCLVCCSKAVAEYTQKQTNINPYKFQVVYNGIDIDEYQVTINRKKTLSELELPENARVIGVVTRLEEPKKGLSYLLEAFRIIVEKNPDVFLVIVGKGPAEKKLRKKAKRLRIQDNVLFLGMRTDIPQLLALFDVFTLFSNYEGFGISIIEAMAAEVPVVASCVGGIREVVADGETGYLVPPRDIKAMASKCLELLEDVELAKQMGKAGRERVAEHFSLKQTVHKTGLIYASLLRLNKIIEREV